MRARPLWVVWMLAAWLGAWLGAGRQPAAAQSGIAHTPAPNAEAPLRIRRIEAPLNLLQDWSVDQVRRVPMQPDEFEALLRTVRAAAPGTARPAVGITAAEYRARLVGDRLVEGTAALEVFHTAPAEALLAVDPCGLAVGQATWEALSPQEGRHEAVVLGLGDDGKLAVPVGQPGTLQFDWSLGGARDGTGTIEFDVLLPRCPASRLLLELPEGSTPVAGGHVLIRLPEETGSDNRWRIELGGHHRFRLGVLPEDEAAQRRRLPRSRQTTVYDFSLNGLEVSAELELDVSGDPAGQVALVLDPGLQLATAQQGDSPVPWTVTSAGAGEGPTTLVLELPEPIEGVGRSLRLRALANLQADRPWQLPRIRPEGTFWLDGSATLLVSAPLVLERLVPIHGRQSSPLSASGARETVDVRFFAPDGTVEVVLTRPEPQVHVESVTDVRFSGGEITAQLGARFRVEGGRRFQLSAAVHPEWIIDSVDSVPADALGDWSVEEQAESSTELTVRLATAGLPGGTSDPRPASPTESEGGDQRQVVQLSIGARRLDSPLGKTFGVEDLSPLAFQEATAQRPLMALRTSESYQLTLAGESELTRVEPQNLGAETLSLFTERPRGVLFENDASAEGLKVSLEARKPGYAATIRVQATVSDTSLAESYVFRCAPQAVRVDRLLVQFSHGRASPPVWTLGSEENHLLTARRLPPEAGPPDAGSDAASVAESWEIRLHRPRIVPFEIRASRTTELSGPDVVSLAWLPEAAQQSATLVVASTAASAMRIEAGRLRPVLAEPVPPDRPNVARATYRYDPARDAGGGSEPALRVVPEPTQTAPPGAWVWRCDLDTRSGADGTSRHLATYRLENAGRRLVRVTLPAAAGEDAVDGVWIDGLPARWHPAENGAGVLDVELPPSRRHPVLAILFSTTGRPLRFVDWISPQPPGVDLPVLARYWTVWLPPGYASAAADPRRQLPGHDEPTWTERLFGPLGRPTHGEPFDPLARGDWTFRAGRTGAIGSGPDRQAMMDRLDKLLELLASRSTGGGGEPGSLDWGTLLADPSVAGILGDSPDDRRPIQRQTLLVDREALARLGLAPRTPVPAVAPGSNSAGRITLLSRANLAMLVCPEAVVLTSAWAAALDQRQLTPLGTEGLWWLGPGELAGRVQRAAAGQPDPGLLLAADWKQRPAESVMPWTARQAEAFGPGDTVGWSAFRMEISGGQDVQLLVVRQAALRALRWGVFLAVLALTSWLAIGRPAVLTALAGLFGAAALVVPPAYAVVASGALLGTLASLGFRLIRRRRERENSGADPDGQDRSSDTTVQAGVAVTALAAVLASCLSAQAQQPAAGASPAQGAYHNVFVPVDSQGNPTGDKYQVPQPLYNELHRRAAAATEKPRGWLLGPGTYRGVLAWRGTPERLALGELKAVFQLRVFDAGARVRIRIGGLTAGLPAGGVLLDGRAIQARWQQEEGLLEFDVAGPPRQHRLELSLEPVVQTDATDAFFQLPIPRLATSQLELTVPLDAPAIEVPTAEPISSGDAGRPLVFRLGRSDRLTVRWPESHGRATTDPQANVQELLWLKVRPGSVVLTCRLKFNVVAGPAREFHLTADPRLRLESYSGLIVQEPTPLGAPGRFRLELSQGASDSAMIEISFLLSETSGLGTLQLPRLEVVDAHSTRRWLAVWLDPRAFEQPGPQGSDAAARPSVADFESAWGAAALRPSLVVDLSSGDPSWSMTTRPAEPRTTVDQKLALSFDRQEIEVHYDAQLATEAGDRLQYRVVVPEAFEVEQVSLTENSVERVGRWSGVSDGSITVFLQRPVSGRQRLSIRGRLPAPKGDKMPLPVVRLVGAESQPSTIELFRKPAVSLSVSEVQGLVEVPIPTAGQRDAALGRPVKVFYSDGTAPIRAQVALEPNRPEVRAEQTTIMRFDGEYWEAEARFRIRAEGGVVDEFGIDVPPQWGGPYTVAIDAPGQWEGPYTVELPPVSGSRLTLRPPSAVSGQIDLTVGSPLNVTFGDRVRGAVIVLRDVKLTKHELILPARLHRQPAAWDTQGLTQIQLPDETEESPAARESVVTYRVDKSPFEAVLSPRAGVARVHLADVNVAWQADGTYHGVTLFDLESADLTACALTLPDDCELVQVKVAGTPALALRTSEHGWRIPLGPGTFPQRIEVVFAGRLPEPLADGRRQFTAPVLGGLPVGQTLWTIAGPSFERLRLSEALKITTGSQHARLRLENVAAMIERAAEATAERPEEAMRWFRSWAGRLAAARQACRREDARSGQSRGRTADAAELRRPENLPPEVADIVNAGDYPEDASASPRPTGDPVELWESTLDRPGEITRAVFPQEASSIWLVYDDLQAEEARGRLLGSAGLAALTLFAVLGVVRGVFSGLLYRWPSALGVAAGLGWWLWLSPSILGWGIVLVSLAASLRWGWKATPPSAR